MKALIVSGNGPTDRQTMSPIELFWTAKNNDINVKLFRINSDLALYELYMGTGLILHAEQVSDVHYLKQLEIVLIV